MKIWNLSFSDSGSQSLACIGITEKAVSELVGPEWGLKFCISNKFLIDADVTGLESTF